MSGNYNRYDVNNNLPYGAWKDGRVFRSTLSLGYKSGGNISEIGINNPWVQDIFQNSIHRWVPFGRQNYYNNYSEFSNPGFYGSANAYNPYSIYGYW